MKLPKLNILESTKNPSIVVIAIILKGKNVNMKVEIEEASTKLSFLIKFY